MAVDTYTDDRLRRLEKRTHELEMALLNEESRRKMTLTWAISWIPIVGAWIVVVAVALARHG